jgi:hypothetical protein
VREPGNDLSASRYERPHQPWICGLAHGDSCPAGPTARGQCPAMAECAPIRNGDRWECNRSKLRGGPCETGPTPEGECGRVHKCRPMRSLRAVRGRFVRACALLAVGAVILVLNANWRDGIIAPGPLARQHAQLLERTGAAANCEACHAAARQSIAGWTASLMASHDRPSQSQLCMNCHAKTISTELALTAHNLSPERLHKITDRKNSRTSGALLSVRHASLSQDRSIGCNACHVEHHGIAADLTRIENDACQACHQRRYKSFAADHPDFSGWPYERRTRTAFNHASHRDKHFAEKKQAFECRSCHIEDRTGSVQPLASYETGCAKCHDEKITTSIARGVPMMVLPTLDTNALQAAGLDIGPWPNGASGDFDGRLPPAMKLLLAADPVASQALITLGADFDFQDVNPKDRRQLEACSALAAETKKLLADLSINPETTVRDRLQSSLGRAVPDAQAQLLVAGLSVDTLRCAAENWSIAGKGDAVTSAVKIHAATSPSPQSGAENRFSSLIAFAPVGEWLRDDASFSIRYRPKAHADPVLATLLTLLAETPNLNERPIPAAMFKELSQPNAPGLCVSCHSIEQSRSGALVVNWRAFDRTKEPRAFTKFSHGPHILLPQLTDCSHCHAIDRAAASATTYADTEPTRFVNDFAPLSKRQCVDCHTAKAAGDACQQCHHYHVQVAGPSF